MASSITRSSAALSEAVFPTFSPLMAPVGSDL